MIDWANILVIDGDFDSLNIINSTLSKDSNEFNYIETYKVIADDSKKARGHYTKGVRTVLTKDQIRTAEEVADHITNCVKRSSSSSEGVCEGLEFRLKSEESLDRKFRDWESSGGNGKFSSKTLREASEDIHDILRFTVIFEPDNFVDNFFAFQDIMQKKNARFVKIKNTFDAKKTYKGVNTFMLAVIDTPNKGSIGYIFELQFHTRQSFDAKMKTYEYYEIERDKERTKDERNEAARQQKIIFSSVSSPNGYQLIKEMDELEDVKIGFTNAN